MDLGGEIKNILWGCHCCDSYLSLPKNEFGGHSCPWSTVLAIPQEQFWWKKAMSEESQKLKRCWDAPPCRVLACGPQGLQRYRLPSLNQKAFVLFLVEKNCLNLPHSSFPFWKGKEALNFLSPYTTTDKWQSGSFTHGNQRSDEAQVVTCALQLFCCSLINAYLLWFFLVVSRGCTGRLLKQSNMDLGKEFWRFVTLYWPTTEMNCNYFDTWDGCISTNNI